MPDRLLVCTDLDRTLIPNGSQPESPRARPLLRGLVARPEVRLTYVTGRDRGLVEEAMAEYRLPAPDFVIGDVGTSIFSVQGHEWSPWSTWHDVLFAAWGHTDGPGMLALFSDEPELTPQEDAKQGRFKCSFYAPVSIDSSSLQQRMLERLERENLAARIIWSIDDNRQLGLIDVVPADASKLHALRLLMQHADFGLSNTLFAGDSGNDLEVLTSDISAVLVANATESIRTQAREQARAAGTEPAFYAATGGFRNMNGNYSAGLLEGLVHFMPETDNWIKEQSD
ncbi:MAG: HAD-IIB family hydrolase [Thiogranum sp.]|nr:HAD-IIB family hydrolase [Thiogranum sp.]